MIRSEICFRHLLRLALVQHPRAAHGPSAAFQASGFFQAGSASCAPATPITSQFRSASTSGMLAPGKAQGASASRLYAAQHRGLSNYSIKGNSHRTDVCPLISGVRHIKYLLKSLAMLAIFSVGPSTAAELTADQIWLAHIKLQYPSTCAVEFAGSSNSVFGNNGYMQHTWTVDTCVGKRMYVVKFFPKGAFPKRASEFQAILLTKQ